MNFETVMVVDDDCEIRTLLSEYPRQSSYVVTSDANTVEMFSLLATISPSLIILDVMMPGQMAWRRAASCVQNQLSRC